MRPSIKRATLVSLLSVSALVAAESQAPTSTQTVIAPPSAKVMTTPVYKKAPSTADVPHTVVLKETKEVGQMHPPVQKQTVVIKTERLRPDEAFKAAAERNGYAQPQTNNGSVLNRPSYPMSAANNDVRIDVIGQGVAPANTQSPAQAYALAKRAAITDAYRLLAEKLSGVRVEGQDVIKNMIVQRSQVRTFVDAMLKEAQIIETKYENGLCEVEMELVINKQQWQNTLTR
jgi:hypothetical protein